MSEPLYKLTTFVGSHSRHGSKSRAYVMIELDSSDEWLTPFQARSLAAKLLRAADRAEVKGKAHKAKKEEV